MDVGRCGVCYLICLRHLMRSRIEQAHIGFFFLRKDMFSFMNAQQLLSHHQNKYHDVIGIIKYYTLDTRMNRILRIFVIKIIGFGLISQFKSWYV